METKILQQDGLLQKYPKIGATFAKTKGGFPVNLHQHHAHLLQELDAAWGTPEFVSLIDDLVFSDRPDRHGFSNEVMMELFALKSHHDRLFPHFVTNQFDPFAALPTDEIDAMLLKQGASRIEKVVVPAAASSATSASPVPAAEVVRQPTKEVPLAQASGPVTAVSQAATTRPIGAWPEIASLEELRQLQKQRNSGERLPLRDRRRIVEILKQYADVTEADLARAIQEQNTACEGKKREPIGKILLQLGIVDEEAVIRALCLQYGVIMVNLQRFHIEAETMRTIPAEVAKSLRAIPIALLDGTLFLAVANPFSFEQREYFVFLTKRKVELVMASAAQIEQKLSEYGQVRSVQQGKEEFRTLAQKALGSPDVEFATGEIESEADSTLTQDDASIVGLVNKIVSDAAEVGASDVHIESFYGDALAYIRFRRDGRLEEYSQYPASYHRAVVSRIKIMANLDISERRIAQDGKISFLRTGRERMDLRVATVPTARGIENVAIRLLHAGDPFPLEALKMSERDLSLFRRLIHRPYGLILVCGPTGSGKTTTLHSALRELNTPDKKIWTAEDPIEIVQKKNLSGTDQSQDRLDLRRGVAFLFACRSRHHHDWRDARSGDRQDRPRGLDDRPRRVIDPAYQFGFRDRGATDRSRSRSFQSRRCLDHDPRPAPDALSVSSLRRKNSPYSCRDRRSDQ